MSDLWSDNQHRPGHVPVEDGRGVPSPPPLARSGSADGESGRRVRRWATRTGELFGGHAATAPAPPEMMAAAPEPGRGRYALLAVALLGCAVIGLVAFVFSGNGSLPSPSSTSESVITGSGDEDNGGQDTGGQDAAGQDTAGSALVETEDVNGPALDVTGTEDQGATTSADPDSTETQTTDQQPTGPASADLASATVQVLGLNSDDEPVCGGSGIVVEASGLILTNAHVVQADESCNITSVGIAVTGDVSDPPELRYRASILVVEDTLDLAVLKIDGSLDGSALPIDDFVAAPLGDSDSVELGDEIRILGYPIIGGETITSTSGTVSGFTSQVGVGSRAIMKTDAAISAGSSGGMALDAEGRVVGIPSRARASESGPPLDCRAVSDTNGDGIIDDDDVCVPVGGFLNGIRPVNLARPILAKAQSLAVELETSTTEPTTTSPYLADVVISNPRFSRGQADNEPIEILRNFAAGSTDICLFVDWQGMPAEGVVWDAVWEVNGKPISQLGHYEEAWTHGESGRNFWICAQDADGHEAGIYEVGLFLDGSLIFAEAVVVAAEPLANYEVTWVNNSDRVICHLAINPLSRSGQVGINELPAATKIATGESVTMTLPMGPYAVEAKDCEGTVLADHPDGGVQIPDPDRSGPDAVVFVLTERS